MLARSPSNIGPSNIGHSRVTSDKPYYVNRCQPRLHHRYYGFSVSVRFAGDMPLTPLLVVVSGQRRRPDWQLPLSPPRVPAGGYLTPAPFAGPPVPSLPRKMSPYLTSAGLFSERSSFISRLTLCESAILPFIPEEGSRSFIVHCFRVPAR